MTDPVDRAAVREMFNRWVHMALETGRFGAAHRNIFYDQLTALPAVSPEGPAWQPIATAPKDGTEILLTDGSQVWAAVWSFPPQVADPTHTDWESSDGHSLPIVFTHWMPLPSPPAQATAEKETQP